MRKKILIKKPDFKEQTPKLLIGKEAENPLYKKAFLSREEVTNEFAQNTTTWD